MNWAPTVTIGLAAALVLGTLARRFGLSPLVGYLLAGIVVGPNTPGFVGNAAVAGQIADVGVVLLMFGVGLGFSWKDLWSVRAIAVPGALVASGTAVLAGAAIGMNLGWGTAPSLVFGMCLATASTVVIVRGFLELDLLGSAAGRIAVGWSVVEDLITVVLLVILPALGASEGGGGSLPLTIAWTIAKVGLLAVLVIVGGGYVVPRLLSIVARAQSKELFTLAILVIALGIAYGSAELFGVSLALGAFFGGMVVGQSDLSHQAAADALPLRDAFAVLFFVAVGMLFDPLFVLSSPLPVLLSLAVVLLLKPLAGSALMLLRGYPLKDTLCVGAGIAQVSEFSFVLAGLAVSEGLLPEDARSLVLAAALLSITASPVLFRGVAPISKALLSSPGFARFLHRRAGKLGRLTWNETEQLQGHAILCGHGRVGSVLAGILRQRGIPFVAIDLDKKLVETLRARGEHALYGDGGSPTLLDRAGVATARAVLITIPDAAASRVAVEHVRATNPEAAICVRVHREAEQSLYANQPNTASVHGELELAYALARRMLGAFGSSAIEAEAVILDARRGGGASAPSDTTLIFELRVAADAPAAGKALSELALPAGALIITIRRKGDFVVPSGKTTLEPQDEVLVLADREGAHAIERLVGSAAQAR
ncbi:MAG: cation:proton antiporter [Planctomycetes bacterium]|nr:cation:proton antiporter [Planctomycetota bacterium]